jgi:hypothetical protein
MKKLPQEVVKTKIFTLQIYGSQKSKQIYFFKFYFYYNSIFKEVEIPFPNQKRSGKTSSVTSGKKIVRATSTTTKGTSIANSPSSVCESAAAILGYFHNATVQGARSSFFSIINFHFSSLHILINHSFWFLLHIVYLKSTHGLRFTYAYFKN